MEDRDYAHELDRFLVEVFNDILKTEESYLSGSCPDLSVRELHLIEEVCRAVDGGRDNRACANGHAVADNGYAPVVAVGGVLRAHTDHCIFADDTVLRDNRVFNHCALFDHCAGHDDRIVHDCAFLYRNTCKQD